MATPDSPTSPEFASGGAAASTMRNRPLRVTLNAQFETRHGDLSGMPADRPPNGQKRAVPCYKAHVC